MKIFLGMECSGQLRRRFQAAGHFTISADLKPAEDRSQYPEGLLGGHIQDEVFIVLQYLRKKNLWPDAAVFHPDCTYVTNSAAWALQDPDFDRYPGVGYHQRIKPETLVGAARREAQREAHATVERIDALGIAVKWMENPTGMLSTLFRPADQTVQPYMFGDDASKATGLWIWGDEPLPVPDRAEWVAPRMIGGKPRWANQTDSGQNRLSPGEQRATDRARTYPGIADALVKHILRKKP